MRKCARNSDLPTRYRALARACRVRTTRPPWRSAPAEGISIPSPWECAATPSAVCDVLGVLNPARRPRQNWRSDSRSSSTLGRALQSRLRPHPIARPAGSPITAQSATPGIDSSIASTSAECTLESLVDHTESSRPSAEFNETYDSRQLGPDDRALTSHPSHASTPPSPRQPSGSSVVRQRSRSWRTRNRFPRSRGGCRKEMRDIECVQAEPHQPAPAGCSARGLIRMPLCCGVGSIPDGKLSNRPQHVR